MRWRATFNCVIELCLLTFSALTPTHTLTHTLAQLGRWRWAERSHHKGKCWTTSKIDMRIYGCADGKGFLCGGKQQDQSTRKLQECRSFCGLFWKMSTHTHTNTHTHTHAFCLAQLPSGVSVSKWEPLSGAQWAWDSVQVMDSWPVVCVCVCFMFMCVCVLDVCGGRGAWRPTPGRAVGNTGTQWRTDPGTVCHRPTCGTESHSRVFTTKPINWHTELFLLVTDFCLVVDFIILTNDLVKR